MINDIGKIISEARQKKNLTIEQLSEITKIRHYIIKAIEAGDYSVMPEIYIKSFLKTIAKYLQINESVLELPSEIKSDKNSKNTFNLIADEPPKSLVKENINAEPLIKIHKAKPKNEEVEKYAELFKKKNVKKVSRVGLLNYSIYSVLALAVLTAIVLTLINFFNKDNQSARIININNSDTLEIEQSKNNLLSYFEKSDSLIVTAKANDTSWVRVVIDGINYIEVLMKPGQEEKWGASEYLMVDQGNVGAINFYRNGELLPMFGKLRTVVKNIKITKDNVLNTSLQKDTIPIQKPYIPKKKTIIKKEPEKPKTPRLIQESQIQTSPNLLNRNKPN
jgi:cytoskeletal protein RodZ